MHNPKHKDKSMITQPEIICMNHGNLLIKRGKETLTLSLEDIMFLNIKFQDHITKWDSLPF